MSSLFPNGSQFAISTTLSEPILVTSTTNANPAVASGDFTDVDDGAIAVLSSNWPTINERVARLDSPSGTSATLEGFDTTNLAFFPAGEGSGSVRIAGDFVSSAQSREVTKTGGEQQFFTYQYIEDRSNRQRQKPTFKNAKALQITMDYDPDMPWFQALVAADEAGEPVVLRITLPNGDQVFYYVYPSFDADPSMTLNENMTNVATFSIISDLTRYDA